MDDKGFGGAAGRKGGAAGERGSGTDGSQGWEDARKIEPAKPTGVNAPGFDLDQSAGAVRARPPPASHGKTARREAARESRRAVAGMLG